MSNRIGIVIGSAFVGFHLFDTHDYDLMAFSAHIAIQGKAFTMGFIFMIYGVDFEIDWGIFDEQD